MRQHTLGLALSRDRLCAASQASESTPLVFRASFGPVDGPTGGAELRDELISLRTSLGLRRGELHIAVLPPVARIRRVTLPDLPEPDLHRIVARDTSKFFPRADAPQRIGMAPIPVVRGSTPQWLVSIVDARWADAVESAADEAGWRVRSMVAAHTAWAAAAPHLWRDAAGPRFNLAVACGERVEVVELAGGSPCLGRSMPMFDDPDTWLASLVGILLEGDAAPAGLLMDIDHEGQIESRLREAGVPVVSYSNPGGLDTSADAVAAAGAMRQPHPKLQSDAELAGGVRRRRRATVVLLACSFLFLFVASQLFLRSEERELERIQAQRAQIRQDVAHAMALQGSIARTSAQIDSLNSILSGSPRWSLVLAELAPHIPRNAYLEAFHGGGDSIRLTGVGYDALNVIRSLETAPGLRQVTSDGPVQRGMDANGSLVERFAVRAHLDPHTAPEDDQ